MKEVKSLHTAHDHDTWKLHMRSVVQFCCF